MYIFEGEFNDRLYYVPECPPDIEAHRVQPEKRCQEEEMHYGSCIKEKLNISGFIAAVRRNIISDRVE